MDEFIDKVLTHPRCRQYSIVAIILSVVVILFSLPFIEAYGCVEYNNIYSYCVKEGDYGFLQWVFHVGYFEALDVNIRFPYVYFLSLALVAITISVGILILQTTSKAGPEDARE